MQRFHSRLWIACALVYASSSVWAHGAEHGRRHQGGIATAPTRSSRLPFDVSIPVSPRKAIRWCFTWGCRAKPVPLGPRHQANWR